MAQRGGSIVAHARIGDSVQSPLVERGTADILLGFEILETARAVHMLRKEGKVVLNTKYLPPNTASNSAKPVTQTQLLQMIRDRASIVHEIDAINIANKLGNPLVVNTILLGALSALPENPVRKESFEEAISTRFKEKFIKINLQAFELGRESVILG